MGNKFNCLVCGKDLTYFEKAVEKECYFCKEKGFTNAACLDGHYICDKCHSSGAYEIIKKYCLSSEATNPIKMAEELMKHPSVKMHGPEHHFLVPAVLVTAYYNTLKAREQVEEKLEEAEKRAKNVLGGFCGLYGNCGAAVGTGIFMSIITGSSPLSTDTWKLCNMMTATSLMALAEKGGPRCCKRDSYISILQAINFVKENMNVNMEIEDNIKCIFSHMNKQCIREKCDFYSKNGAK